MKANVTVSNSTDTIGRRQSHAATFSKVLDGRKQPIRGLWERNGRYYAQITLENAISGEKKVRRVPLKDKEGKAVDTVPQALAEMKRLQIKRTDNELPVLTRTPKFSDYALHYLDFISSGQGTKKSGTIQKERTTLAQWTEHIGNLRLNQIKRVHVNRFMEKRLKQNLAPRTVNLDVISLRNVLKRGIEDGYIQRLPTEGMRPLKTSTEKRQLFTTDNLDTFCAAAFGTRKDEDKEVSVTKNAQEFVDYVKLMAYSGARRNEALGLRWDDVDFRNNQLFIRRQVARKGIEDLKNRDARVVDFNPKLKGHLAEMKSRSHDVSQWLFPSPQRGDKDVPAKTFRESLVLVRNKSKLADFGFHDCRHHFISMCVMSGVDFMTIAAWVGHKDGGVLIGKVYGHLANEHRRAMANRVSFEPLPVQDVAKA
ncbi:MAG: tyrosine-type recombinase/integrase [Limisphaerales bacterium]